MPIMIVGNKCDEENRREVKKDLASKLVSDVMKDSGFMETSARLNVNVQQAFQVSNINININNDNHISTVNSKDELSMSYKSNIIY